VREALFGSGLDPRHVEEYEDSGVNDVVTFFDSLIDKYPNCRNFVIKADQDGAICISEENKKNRPIDPFIIDAIFYIVSWYIRDRNDVNIRSDRRNPEV